MIQFRKILVTVLIIAINQFVFSQKFDQTLPEYNLSKYQTREMRDLIKEALNKFVKEKKNCCQTGISNQSTTYVRDVSFSQLSYSGKGQVVTDTLKKKWIPKKINKHKILLKTENEIQAIAEKQAPDKLTFFVEFIGIKIINDSAQIAIGQSCKRSSKSNPNSRPMCSEGSAFLFKKANNKWVFIGSPMSWVD
jgi:hypothetical protein